MPKVSVIIPLYNGERFIQEGVNSVLGQTFQDFELIVVDDGSTDRSGDIVLSMKDRLAYVYQDNSGVCAARNRGFLQSRGEYIAFLDQDDVWYPRKLEIQVSFLDKEPEIGVVYSDVDLTSESGELIETNHLITQSRPPGDRVSEFMLIFSQFPDPHPYPSTVLMRRDVFLRSGMFDPEFKKNCHEDTELWFRIVHRKLAQFFFIDESLVKRRIHNLQGGRDEKVWFENWSLCLQKIEELYSDEPGLNGVVRRLRRLNARMCSRQGKELIRMGQLQQGRELFRRSFRFYPFYWKNIGRLVRSYWSSGRS